MQYTGPVDFWISVTDEDIKKENQLLKQGYSKGYLESLAVYRKLSEKMLEYQIFLFHCSAVALDGRAYLFTAPSGTGKSTHAGLWQKYFKDKVLIVNDDKPLIRADETGVWVYGTPWCGKHGKNTNICVPVQAVCVLEQGKVPELQKLSPIDGYINLYQQTYRPKDEMQMRQTLGLLNRVISQIPIYRLRCDISMESVRIAYEGMRDAL